MVSYYFTLFKKFQVFDHVPEGNTHGAPGGHAGFDLNNPHVLFVNSATGAPLGAAAATLPNVPVYQSLLTKYTTPSNTGFITVAGSSWPVMPRIVTQAWTDLQATPPLAQGTLNAFETWFSAGHADDTPDGVIALMPPTIPSNQLSTPDTVFVCSYATDVGLRPGGVPADFWETSLIYVTDPASGAIIPNAPLTAGAKYNLVAIVGTRYADSIGQYMYGGSTNKTVQAQAWVMVWNAGMGPGVQLPSLSNQDPTSESGIYDIYMLKQGQYDIVGFELDVQRAFDALVAAVVSQMSMTEAQAVAWLTASAQGAHLCARVVIARTGGPSPDAWPTSSDLPTANARIAQRNLSAFPINMMDTSNPYPKFHAFAVGDPMAMMALHGDDRWGRVQLVFRPELEAGIRLYLAASRETVKQWFPRALQRQLKRVELKPGEGLRLPFDDTVVFELPREGVALELPRLGGTMLPLSLGIQYDVKKLKPGRVGVVRVEQRTLVPRLVESDGAKSKACCYELEYKTGGGFTLELEAYDPRLPPRRPKAAGPERSPIPQKAASKRAANANANAKPKPAANKARKATTATTAVVGPSSNIAKRKKTGRR